MRKLHTIAGLALCLLFLTSAIVFVSAGNNDVIHISNVDAFLEFAENCRLDQYSAGKVFLLTADLDLTGTDFDGIPIFCGTFDGGYHKITGLNIGSAGSNKGLFRYLSEEATVMNLNVEGSFVPFGSRSIVGGMVGTNHGLIKNCTFSGTVTGGDYVGGIAGRNEASGKIVNCSTSGVISANHFSGGIAGYNEGTIQKCCNNAGINLTAQQNDIDISDINMGTLTNTESAIAATDIGGIAGFSSGTILDCANRGNVGYPHMGYNVGGIVGRQAGYVSQCLNFGAVYGRKEVGGIAGQQEPQIVLHYQTDTLQILKGQFAVLSDLIDRLSMNSNSNIASVRNLLHKLETHIANAEAALDVLEEGLKQPRWEDLQIYKNAIQTIQDSIKGIETTLRSLWDAMDKIGTDLDADMAAISEQLAVIENTLNNAEDHLGGQIFDISDQDTENDLISKIEKCSNHGPILADLYAGGIVGAVVFENDLDPEEDISVVGEVTLNAVGSLRSVILSCENSATVTAKNQHIGGIVGWLSMGLVKDCVNSGAIDNVTADYVGGIAGESAGFIRNCRVKCLVSGSACVGGIAGSGTIVTDCFAMVQLSGTEKMGCILGISQAPEHKVEQPILGNYYLQYDYDYGAIDGVSYDQKAQGLSMDDFLVQTTDLLFHQVTIRFIADGTVVLEVTQNAGEAFAAVPDVPHVPGYSGCWENLDAVDLQHVLFDLNIHANYVAYSSTIQSDLVDENNRPLLLLQGDFEMDATATLTTFESFTALAPEQTLLEAWKLDISQCVDLHGGRLLVPSNVDLAHTILLVRDCNGNWQQRTYTIDNSYIVFPLASGDDGIALVTNPSESILTADVLVAAGVGGATVLLVVVVILLISRGKKKVTTKE